MKRGSGSESGSRPQIPRFNWCGVRAGLGVLTARAGLRVLARRKEGRNVQKAHLLAVELPSICKALEERGTAWPRGL